MKMSGMYVVATCAKRLKSLDNPYDYTNFDVPTFFLNEDVQGIVDEAHARKIVEDIVNPTKDPLIVVHATSIRKLGC